MDVNHYLAYLASKATIKKERPEINLSINTLQSRLNAYPPNNITKQFIFGSYARNTILPRAMDPSSDVDYMIVFSDASLKPQTYLNHLKTFAECYYSTSIKTQSSPAIVLSLEHIDFDLVPAIKSYLGGLQIPAKASEYQDWIPTDPNDFNQKLTSANQANSDLIKPLIKLVKYWNVLNSHPFESFDLEQRIVGYNRDYNPCIERQLKDYLYCFMEKLDLDSYAPQWKQHVLNKAKQIIIEARKQDHDGYSAAATYTITKLFL